MAAVNYNLIVPNSASFISGGNISPGESFYFNVNAGNLYTSGAVIVSQGINGSHQYLRDGTTPAFVGNGVTVNLEASGRVAITGSGGAVSSYWYSDVNQIVKSSGSFEVSGSGLIKSNLIVSGTSAFVGVGTFTSGLSGSLTKLSDGTSFIVAGSNVTVASASNGAITISSTATGGGSGDPNATYLVVSTTSSLNAERALAAGPGIIFNDKGANSLFEISSSLLAGPNITITTQSNGQIAISASITGGSGGSTNTFLFAAGYTATVATSSSPAVGGQFRFIKTEHNTGSIFFRVVLSAESSATGSVRLYNFTSGAYVDLNGPALFPLSWSTGTPTAVTSVNLTSSAGWTDGDATYEVRLHTSDNTKNAILGSGIILTKP